MLFDPLSLRIKLFSDGANIDDMIEMSEKTYIKGFTTNPTLMRKAGIKDYQAFGQLILREIKDKPISFEVFSDELDTMYDQGLRIADWAENVYVKIPITNSRGESTRQVVEKLTKAGSKLNITAIMTESQVKNVSEVLNPSVCSYVSIFAGRIADTGRDPTEIIKKSIQIIKHLKNTELIWASPRELLNILQADAVGCHIITSTKDLLNKLSLINKDLDEYSLETVKMFYDDAIASGFNLK